MRGGGDMIKWALAGAVTFAVAVGSYILIQGDVIGVVPIMAAAFGLVTGLRIIEGEE